MFKLWFYTNLRITGQWVDRDLIVLSMKSTPTRWVERWFQNDWQEIAA